MVFCWWFFLASQCMLYMETNFFHLSPLPKRGYTVYTDVHNIQKNIIIIWCKSYDSHEWHICLSSFSIKKQIFVLSNRATISIRWSIVKQSSNGTYFLHGNNFFCLWLWSIQSFLTIFPFPFTWLYFGVLENAHLMKRK